MEGNHTFQLSESIFFLHNGTDEQQCPWRSRIKKKEKKETATFILVIDEGRDTEDTVRKVAPQKGA